MTIELWKQDKDDKFSIIGTDNVIVRNAIISSSGFEHATHQKHGKIVYWECRVPDKFLEGTIDLCKKIRLSIEQG